MDKKLLEKVKEIVTQRNYDVRILYLYLHKIEGGYVCMGKAKGDLRKVKEVAEKIKGVIAKYGETRVIDGANFPPINTVVLKNEYTSDQAVQMALVKAKFNNEDCIMNGSEWLGKEVLRSVGGR